MSQFVQQATEASDQYLATLAQSQDAVLAAMAKTSTLNPAQAPQAPVPEFASSLPSPREISEVAFNFAEKLLTNQKAYAEKLLALGETTATHE